MQYNNGKIKLTHNNNYFSIVFFVIYNIRITFTIERNEMDDQVNLAIDQAVTNVLSSKRLMLAHPGGAQLHALYPYANTVTTHLAECVNSRGRFRVPSNGQQFGSKTTFSLSSSSIVSDMILSFDVTVGAVAAFTPCTGWGFECINNIEITFSNSLIQQSIIPGPVIRDMLLLSCRDKESRNNLLKNAGKFVPGSLSGLTISAALPILTFIQNASGQYSHFGIDMSTLNGPILISVEWNPQYKVFTGADANVLSGCTLSASAITCRTTELMDAAFSIKRGMSLNPDLVYSIPAHYYSTVPYNLTATAVGAEYPVINLNSAPSGMLNCILLHVRKTAYSVAAGTTPFSGTPVPLKSIRLQYGGTDLYYARSKEEIKSFDLMDFGDSLEYDCLYRNSILAIQTKNDDCGGTLLNEVGKVYVIPFGNEMRKLFREKLTENLPSYSGATLQLTITADNSEYYVNSMAVPGAYAAANVGITSAFIPQSADLRSVSNNAATCYVTYVLESLLELSSGQVDLQL